MAKTFISERIKFKNKEDQKDFVQKCMNILGGSRKTAALLSVSERTVADWKRGKFSVPYTSAILLSKATKTPILHGAYKSSLIDHLSRAGKKGGNARYRIYGTVSGDEDKRKTAWRKWWAASGKKTTNPLFKPKVVSLPPQNEQLAEFFGIMLGDGGVAPYHTSITLNATRDAAYANFVETLLYTLFGVKPKRYKKKTGNAIDIILHRKEIVLFCISLGLPFGNKLRKPILIPNWIKENSTFAQACVRGLIDTDGCVFIHRYRVKGREYSYVKIGFSSASPQLLDAVYDILINSGIGVKKKYTFREIRIENTRFVDMYMRTVGSHNPKHIAVWENQRRGARVV